MQKTDFNRDWTVQKDGSNEILHVNLPDDAMIREERSKENKTASASAYFAGGKYIYTKIFDLSENETRQTLILEFEAVYQNATVFLNGRQVAEHPYGYTNFFVDITGKVIAGTNELKVVADNADVPNSRWYSGSGIYREVHLYRSGSSYIRPEGLKVQIVDLNTIHIFTDAVMQPDEKIVLEIFNDTGKIVSSEGTDVTITIPDAHLWSAEDPYLYTCKATLLQNGTAIDTARTSFGIRTLSWGKDGFLVNSKSVLFRGACIHHDNGVLGACGFHDAECRRVRILKEAGFNAIRSSHNPISKAMLDACDQLGMYIIDEAFDMWLIKKNPYDYAGETFSKWWKADIAAMISKDYNHSSVVMYSVGNEITELGLADGQEQARIMTEFCHTKDHTRPVTAGINLMLATMAGSKKSIYGTDEDGKVKDSGSGGLDNAPTSEFFNIMMNKMGGLINKAAKTKKATAIAEIMSGIFDIPGYNYASSRYKIDARNHPEQATTGSETLPQTLYDNWQLVKSIPTMTGDFMWTGYDYLGESGIGTIQYKDKKTKQNADPGLIISGGAGIIDICGKKRPEVGWSKIIWGLQKTPTIGVDPYTRTDYFQSLSMWRVTDAVESWSWEGCEGCKTNVTVYTSAPKAELYCNGKRIASAKVKECKAVFKRIEYVPGTLSAIVYDENGKEIDRAELFSAIGKTMIQLSCDKQKIRSNGQDLCFIEVSLIGENGIIKASADQMLTVQVEGSGVLQGFGSAVPNTNENFTDGRYRTYHGRALIAVRAGYEPGEIKVTVKGEGLRDRETKISVVGTL